MQPTLLCPTFGEDFMKSWWRFCEDFVKILRRKWQTFLISLNLGWVHTLGGWMGGLLGMLDSWVVLLFALGFCWFVQRICKSNLNKRQQLQQRHCPSMQRIYSSIAVSEHFQYQLKWLNTWMTRTFDGYHMIWCLLGKLLMQPATTLCPR